MPLDAFRQPRSTRKQTNKTKENAAFMKLVENIIIDDECSDA